MPRTNSTVKIVDGKVVFSQEIIDYFENLRNEENSEWIDKYFDVLMKDDNIDAEKFNMHHIRPCCTFKDEEHKNRKQTQKLGDEFNGNLIKLSVYNHFFAHFYLWKIFDIRDLKIAFQKMCGQGKYINNLTEYELNDVARLKEECAKKNQTEEERKEYNKKLYRNNIEKISKQHKEWRENNKDKIKKWYEKNKEKESKRNKEYRKNNKDIISKKEKEYRKENKEIISKRRKKYYENNKEKILKQNKIYYENNKEKITKQQKEWRENNKEKLLTKQKEQYKNNKTEILKKNKERYELNKEKILKQQREYRKTHKEETSEKEKKRSNRQCYDPIKEDFLTYGALKGRKSRNKEIYKNINPSDCIIK